MMAPGFTYTDGRLVERIVDNGDGTGTRTTYTPEGDVDTVEELTGLPVPEPVESLLSPEQVAVQVIREEVSQRLAPSGVNSIAEMKRAFLDGLDAAEQRLA